MGISNRIDVRIADSAPATPDPVTPTLDPVEAVDVTPDPEHRIIIVARTKTDGIDIAETRGIHPAAIVTPRTPHAARGISADSILWADDLTHEQRATLEPDVLPAVATHQAGE